MLLRGGTVHTRVRGDDRPCGGRRDQARPATHRQVGVPARAARSGSVRVPRGRATRWRRRPLGAASTKAIANEAQHAVDASSPIRSRTRRAAAIVGTTLELDLPLSEILASHTRLHTAEGVLYRSDRRRARAHATIATTLVPPDELDDRAPALDRFGKVPPPWRREHKDATLAAIRASAAAEQVVAVARRELRPQASHVGRA